MATLGKKYSSVIQGKEISAAQDNLRIRKCSTHISGPRSLRDALTRSKPPATVSARPGLLSRTGFPFLRRRTVLSSSAPVSPSFHRLLTLTSRSLSPVPGLPPCQSTASPLFCPWAGLVTQEGQVARPGSQPGTLLLRLVPSVTASLQDTVTSDCWPAGRSEDLNICLT